MDRVNLQMSFNEWAELACRQAAGAEEIVAFNFNLYEHAESYAVELTGAPTYDPEDPDWACDDMFEFRDPLFEIPKGLVGSNWEKGLSTAAEMIEVYLKSGTSAGETLRSSSAVTVGFVDGDLLRVWPTPGA